VAKGPSQLCPWALRARPLRLQHGRQSGAQMGELVELLRNTAEVGPWQGLDILQNQNRATFISGEWKNHQGNRDAGMPNRFLSQIVFSSKSIPESSGSEGEELLNCAESTWPTSLVVLSHEELVRGSAPGSPRLGEPKPSESSENLVVRCHSTAALQDFAGKAGLMTFSQLWRQVEDVKKDRL